MSMTQPLRFYVHTPFCLHKCHYCDFNSHVFSNPPWEKYQQALLKEIEYYAQQPQFKQRRISSIFFGGGTPSLAPPELFEAVLHTLQTHFSFANDIEISLEANPGASEAQRFQAYRAAGINRVSIGVQSFDAAELKWLERIHSADEAIKAYHIARDAGFDNINLDLMYALPKQSLASWFTTLEKALALEPEHLSCYQLTVEPHTQLAITHKKQALALPHDDLALDFLWQTRQRLQQAGYQAYEISNFAKAGKTCQHNQGYWLYDDYVGIGAGAAGKWDAEDGGVWRYSNLRSPNTYIDTALQHGKAVGSDEYLNLAQAMGEAMWLGLRQSQGIHIPSFSQRFGNSPQQAYPQLLQQWLQQEQLKQHQHYLQLTEQGLNIADDIAASFLVAV
ncbi:MAG: radical SAM family heme chaperone HemW [Mariprofundaceae bacterium]|nr:radical SAM family heme chaperone HemW [Mariprofundaceae bacterium]